MRDVSDIVQALATSKSGTLTHIEFIRLPVHGGTTCTILCIICGNTGDSDAILLSRKPSGLPQDNNKCKYLSVGHSPDNADEFLKIKNLAYMSSNPKRLNGPRTVTNEAILSHVGSIITDDTHEEAKTFLNIATENDTDNDSDIHLDTNDIALNLNSNNSNINNSNSNMKDSISNSNIVASNVSNMSIENDGDDNKKHDDSELYDEYVIQIHDLNSENINEKKFDNKQLHSELNGQIDDMNNEYNVSGADDMYNQYNGSGFDDKYNDNNGSGASEIDPNDPKTPLHLSELGYSPERIFKLSERNELQREIRELKEKIQMSECDNNKLQQQNDKLQMEFRGYIV